MLRQGRLRAGTIDSFLVWRLTGGRHHVTDFSNASRTMLFGLETLDWDESLLDFFGIPRDILADPVPSSGVIGATEPRWLGGSIPIAGLAGDQQTALFGQACFNVGDTKNTYGTGGFLLMNVGQKPVVPPSRLLGTVAWGLGPGRENVSYALEGSVFVAGAAVQWLRDGLGIIERSDEIGPLAASVADNGGLFFVPALTGLGAPFWDPDARGLIIGITRGTTKAHLARATEGGDLCQTRALLEAMELASDIVPAVLRVDGGAARDAFLLQMQADLLGLPVRRPTLLESTAFGAAALAGVAVGLWSVDDVTTLAKAGETYLPVMDTSGRDALYGQWMRSVEGRRAGHPPNERRPDEGGDVER